MRISDWSSDVCSSDLPADVLDRRQGVANRHFAVGRALDPEIPPRPVDVRREQRDPQLLQLLPESVQLVGVAHVVGHRRGQELGRAIGLQIGGLIGDQGVCGGMALVRSEEHTSELQSLMRISYADSSLKKKNRGGKKSRDPNT